ncbi:hypothetical protein EV174_003163 [Coemansia sp. RSA 2320]|nr:hypothetical protein EV174_003163 [Coemansia sp. RSA 2320]
MQCSDISQSQQQLLFQCYCKTVYNTNFFNFKADEGVVVCTRMDKDNYHVNSTEICQDYQKYDDCPGISISSDSAPRASISVSKAALVAIVLSSLLFV